MRTLQSSKNEVDLNFLNYEFEVTFSVHSQKLLQHQKCN